VFPEAAELLRLRGFEGFGYFRGTTDYRRHVDHETWADQRFDFTASLTYHYPKEDPGGLDCAQAVVLMVKHPPTAEAEARGQRFIAFFEQSLHGDLSRLRSTYADYGRRSEGAAPVYREQLDGIMAEVTIVHNVVRGDFLSVGFYDREYYRLAFPES
jgi:hypothetical protein